MKKKLSFLFPAGGTRRKVIRKLLVVLHLRNYTNTTYYNTWFWQQHQQPELQFNQPITDGPQISVIVPVYNTSKRYFFEMIYSIISQAYQNWELILVNASDDDQKTAYIAESIDKDRRIRLIKTKNAGISANTNLGIAAAKGSFIAFVDHDDTLDPYALYEVAKAITGNDAELIYSDEDKISDDSQTYFDPHYKPDWSPDLFTHVNYINHLTVVKLELLNKVGALDPSKDGAQDYDLLLRVIDQKPVIYHIPRVLYHWRSVLNSTAQNFESKRDITLAGVAALSEHFARRGIQGAKVTAKENRPGFYETQLQPYQNITLIIMPFASDALFRLYTELLLLKTNLKNIKLELIIPEGVEPTKEIKNIRLKVLPTSHSFLEEALSAADNEAIIVISQVMLPLQKKWLEKLSGLLRLNHVAAVAPLIVAHGSTIEDAGLVKVGNGNLEPLFYGAPFLNNQTFFGNTDWVRNVDSLSGGFILSRKKDLAGYLHETKPKGAFKQQLQSFSANAPEDRFNVIYSDVLFDNYSICLRSGRHQKSFYNPNLQGGASGFGLYTSEAAAISILALEKEVEEGKVL